ncbi:maturin isoform X1 [Pongo pygmaeus]|uniref:maturin isoform X1 n=1 Tax=Pongo abelii TaxID=9601 RepID=UPI0023E8A5A5|nr:maturin isoform X1 [Pongo abelii]
MVLQHALRAHRHRGDRTQDGFLRRPRRLLLCAVSGQRLRRQFWQEWLMVLDFTGRSPHSLPAGTAQAIPKEMTPKTHVWSESEDCLPFLQLAQDYISSCGKKTLHEVLEKVFKSFRPLLGLPDADDDAFEEYSADVEEEEPEADHPQMGVSQQ